MSVRVRLLFASALMLSTELALIRWLGANIVHLSYFSNFVLLGSFLGIGLGFLRAGAPSHGPRPMPVYSLVVLLGLVGFVSAYPVTVDRNSTQLIFFTTGTATSGPPIWLTLPAVFLAVAAVLSGPGEIVGSCFGQLERLEAYRLDLLGSLLGIAGFTALSYLGAPPLVWFTIIGVLFIALLGRPAMSVSITVLIAILVMFLYPLLHDTGDFWSPYYKVSTSKVNDGNGGIAWNVAVNGVPHQRLTSAATREVEEPYYLQTYAQTPRPPGNVLIVGAGTGTDVAIALKQGAKHVDAVEIDPTLLRFGRQHNPDRAYDSPRVTTHVNDGRAFLESTSKKFDLIVFALPDSLTLVSGASSLRLESYLFTKQSVQVVRSHLAPHGAFSMYNFYRQQWLVDRLAGTLEDVFGHAPCVFQNSSVLAVMTAGLTTADQSCTPAWRRPPNTPPPATDDKPFLYLEHSTIPSLYRTALLLIILASVLAIGLVLFANAAAGGRGAARRLAGQARDMWCYRDLFLLGAAFLLIETKSVTGFALLFGTTWVVNSLVFGGVLLAVLAAVEVTHRVKTPPLIFMYGLLLGGLALNWVIPASWLLSLGVLPRGAAAITISFLPIFAANIIFAKRFSTTANAPLAFGTNLLGAIVGGCLEYLSLVFGYRALLVLAAVLYLGAYAVMPRTRATEAPTDVERKEPGQPVRVR
ncbi:MAG: methyltransferase domain-containing protein [Actinomycetota bacterium]|nr:methyltransferase domain-containing protein [Actinomycetota bacterium]